MSAKLDIVPVRVRKKNLVGAIGPDTTRLMRYPHLRQVSFPRRDIVDQQGVVVAAVLFDLWIFRIADQMQFLIVTQSKPCPRKRKRRAGKLWQTQHITIEHDAARYVDNMNGNVIELQRPHERPSCLRHAARSSGLFAATAVADPGAREWSALARSAVAVAANDEQRAEKGAWNSATTRFWAFFAGVGSFRHLFQRPFKPSPARC